LYLPMRGQVGTLYLTMRGQDGKRCCLVPDYEKTGLGLGISDQKIIPRKTE
jgi:hypothetical protein